MRRVATAVLAAGLCRAEVACPYLNSATAGGILGGSVAMSVATTGKDNDDAVCEFTREAGAGHEVLRIEVKTMSHWRAEFPAFLEQCGSNAAALRGIGNEAHACSGTAKDGKIYDQILSRVRERSLLVLITTSDKNAAAGLREKSRQIAEEAAGNLF